MTDFLYPFIDSHEKDVESLLSDLSASAAAKISESSALSSATVARYAPELDVAAAAMALRFQAGGRALTFGNGGSATDAEALAALLSRVDRGRPLGGWSLPASTSVVTALGNDVGFDLVYSRQIIAFGRPEDIAVGFSTSGNSANLMQAFAEARQRGLLTIGFAGYDGGRMAAPGVVDHSFVVRSQSVHRIQEAQSALTLALWHRLRDHLDRAPAGL